MRIPSKFRSLAVAVAACGLTFSSFQASPEDIDIFAVDESNLTARPNVLIVLDNSANWARQSQQWPEAEEQGQSEVAALKAVISELDASVNVGLLEFITSGSAADQDSGFVRHHIRPMSGSISDPTTNKGALAAKLDTIYSRINNPDEKRPQSNPFGNLFWDVRNYLAGDNHSNAGAGTLDALSDDDAYATKHSRFQSPLTSADTCTRTVVIFIGNNVSNGPTPDSTANVEALRALAGGGDAGNAAVAQIPFADYVVTSTPATSNLGYTNVCYSSASTCSTAVNNTACTDQGFTSCSCSTTAPITCPSTHWTVTGTKLTSQTDIVAGPDSKEETNQSTGDIIQNCKTSGQAANLNPTTCPSSTDVTQANTPVAGQSTRTQVSWETGSCKYVSIGNTNCSPASKENYQKQGTKTTITTVYETKTTTETETVGETPACYNSQASCSTAGFDCSGYNGGCACTAPTGNTSGCAPGNTSRFQMLGNYTITAATQTGTYSAAPAGPFMMDEWARFLRQTGVLVPGGGGVRSQVTTYTIDVFNAQQHPAFSALLFNAARVGGGKYFQAKNKDALINALRQIFTEVQAVNSAFSSASLPVNATNRAQNENQVFIGVFKPDRQKRPSWFGNLKRYQLISTGATIELGDANGNAAVNEQTGFITECAVSFWTTDSGSYWLTPITTDPQPLGACTTNSTSDLSDLPDGPFVEKGAVAEVIRKGNDPAATPDGSGNYALNRTVYTVTATTASGSVPPDFDAANTGLDDALVDFIRGHDVKDEDLDAPPVVAPALPDPNHSAFREPRSTIHGDVVHSRPQPLNFGGTAGVVVFYGSNDGHYRAIEASTGRELWSFVAPEHYDKLKRLFNNDPNVRFYKDDPVVTALKDYFFDGSTGVFQTFNPDGTSDRTYIYPSMRRGGRKVYGFDVSTPATPRYLFSKGCGSTDDATCDSGFEAIGQTWALPNVGLIRGHSTTDPVVVIGGGYDGGEAVCDDLDVMLPSPCAKGKGVYVLDGTNGNLLRHFDFSTLSGVPARGVAADIALIDIDADKMVDYAYAVDTGGNVYRMDFINYPDKAPLTPANWRFRRVAYTNQNTNPATTDQDPRKFLFPPALVQATAGTIYLAIGTGDREHPLMSQYPFGTEGDAASAVLNRFYVFKNRLDCVDVLNESVDPVQAGQDGVCDGSPSVPMSLNLDSSSAMADYSDSNACSNADITPSSAKQGWFIDLNEQGQGEQVVTSAVIAAGFVFFSTNRPTPASANSCTTSLGEARGYFLNLLDASGAIGVSGACGGRRSSTFVGGGLPPSPVLATVPIDGQLRTVVIGAVQKTGEPSSPIEAQRVRPPIPSNRTPIYWYKSTGDR